MTTKEKQEAISKRLGEIYPQLRINTKKICTYNFPQWGEDLIAHSIESFLKMDLDKQYRIMVADDAGEHYITRSMAISLKSVTSTFYRVHRLDLYNSRELLEINYQKPVDGPDESIEKVECIAKAVKSLPFYDKYLITKHYYEGVNVAELGRQVGIQPARLTSDIKIALLKIKKLCR